MIAPPQPESRKALDDYLQATKAVNGVVQATLKQYSDLNHMRRQLAHEWGIFYTEEERERIIVEYTKRRLER